MGEGGERKREGGIKRGKYICSLLLGEGQKRGEGEKRSKGRRK